MCAWLALAGLGLAAGATAGSRGASAARSPATPARRTAPGGDGVSVSYPSGWHLRRPPITDVAYPVDRLLLSSYPARSGGSCSPDRAERELPSGGALVYLFEYTGRRASAWARDFPPEPTRFALGPQALGDYECWVVPSYLIRFRAAGRFFQLHVALGRGASAARRAQVVRILDGLRISPAPPLGSGRPG